MGYGNTFQNIRTPLKSNTQTIEPRFRYLTHRITDIQHKVRLTIHDHDSQIHTVNVKNDKCRIQNDDKIYKIPIGTDPLNLIEML